MQETGTLGEFSINRGKSSSFTKPKLTRGRKLRHVSGDELGLTLADPSYSSSGSPDSARKLHSPVRSEHWSSSAVPKPLPLPELPFIPESSGSSPGLRFGSSEERSSRGRKITNHTTNGSARSSSHFHKGDFLGLQVESVNGMKQSALVKSTPTNRLPSPVVSPPKSNIPNVTPLNNGKSLSNRRRDFSHELNIDRTNYNFDVSHKSAPTSVFSSPAVSPQGSKTGNLFSSFGVPKEIQAQSTTEVSDLGGFTGSTSPVSPVKRTVYSTDHSPRHSPTRQSLQSNLKGPSKFALLHHKSDPLNSKELPESNSHVNAHPLPLPPRAFSLPNSSTPSAFMHPITETPSASSMKNQWQKGKLIGRGTFGSVYIATNRETGASCAMKEVDIIPDDPKSAECIKQLEQEIKVLRHLNHPNIVQYYGSEVVDDHFYIYLEYVHPGSINKYIREHCGAITESIVRNFTRHILAGLAYLHSTKTIHRDIKGANLLVDASGVVKLADFGMAKHLTGLSYELSLKGSPYWMAPEVMQAVMEKDANPNLALAVDVWSLGCTVIEMFTGKPPWSELEGPQAMCKVLHTTPPIPETLSSEGKDFLQFCFRKNPAERSSAAKLLEHPFVQNSNDQNVSACKQPFSKMNLVDKSRNSVDRALCKTDTMPVSPNTQIRNTKLPSTSETCQQCYTTTFNCAAASHYSPCSTLGVNISVSPSNAHNFSPSSNVSSNIALDAVTTTLVLL